MHVLQSGHPKPSNSFFTIPRCSLGKQFQDPFQRKITYETNSMQCGWDGIWQPSSQIYDCVCELLEVGGRGRAY